MSNSSLSEKFIRAAIGGKDVLRMAACGVVCAQLAVAPAGWAAEGSAAKATNAQNSRRPAPTRKKLPSDPVLKVMEAELSRANKELGKTDQAPYYLSYTVYDQDFVVLVGALRQLADECGGEAPAGGCDHASGHAGTGQYAWTEPRERRDLRGVAAFR